MVSCTLISGPFILQCYLNLVIYLALIELQADSIGYYGFFLRNRFNLALNGIEIELLRVPLNFLLERI